jgi:hypothetical protein
LLVQADQTRIESLPLCLRCSPPQGLAHRGLVYTAEPMNGC